MTWWPRGLLAGKSIGWKLVAVLVCLNAFGFLLASGGLFLDHHKHLRASLSNELAILTQVVGDNCRAALVFGDDGAATETLRALRANSHVVEALLLDADGAPFARYVRRGVPRLTPDDLPRSGAQIGDGEAYASSEVELDGRTVGRLILNSDLESWRASLKRFSLVAGLMFLSVSLLLMGLGIRLQRLFTDPIADLVRTTRQVTDTEDYTIRARKRSEDELGTLVDGFNAMLTEIESRDAALRAVQDELSRHLDELEQQREQLAGSNLALQREVQEREQAEMSTAEYARKLKESNSELEQFAYVASHDLQEPLRGISGSLQLLERRYRGRLDEDADRLIGFAVDGAGRLQRLIVDLLSYSRLNTRDHPLEPVDCEAVRKQVLADLAVTIVEAKAKVTHDPLPTVIGDRTQLPLLFQNLISNALKFRGEAPPEIHLHAERKDGAWVFSVRDNGIGIEPRFSARIFEIFQRLHNRTEYQGTGIGLAISKKIVDRHRGAIWVESEPDAGTTFFFSIPEREVHAHA